MVAVKGAGKSFIVGNINNRNGTVWNSFEFWTEH